MSRPVIAIVGRPNVGKSTLFNKLIGKRLSIVDDTPGVTRDRIYGDCEWLGRNMLLVDTGGIEPYSDDIILSQMRRQAQLAIESADVIVLVTDVRSGVVATDTEVAQMLQKSGKPIVLCVNKCDRIGDVPPEFYEFYNLGLGDPIPVSSIYSFILRMASLTSSPLRKPEFIMMPSLASKLCSETSAPSMRGMLGRLKWRAKA